MRSLLWGRAVAAGIALAWVVPTAVWAVPGIVTREGTALRLDGAPYRFMGVNRYGAANWSPYNCGWDGTDFDAYLEKAFKTLREDGGINAVRFWGFQSFAGASGTDYTAFDRVIAKARRYSIRLIFTLENQWADCTRGAPATGRDKTWYELGYRAPDPGYALSYRDYVAGVVARYRDEPTILMWELVNEPECKDSTGAPAPGALLAFARDVSDMIRSVDPNHLISLGTMGTGQPGTAGDDLERLHALPNIDIISVHDYRRDGEAFPGSPLLADVGAKLFLQDLNWVWKDGGTFRPPIGTWTTRSFTVPAGLAFPLQRIGLYISGNPSSWSGTLSVDRVSIGANHSYSYESAVAPWIGYGSVIQSLTTTSERATAGLRSLAIRLAARNASGRVNLEDPTGIAAGDVMSLDLHTPENAPVYNKNTVAYAFHVARKLNKPVFVGEAGIQLNSAACPGQSGRASCFRSKVDVASREGADGYLIWQYKNADDAGGVGGYDFSGEDPLMDVLLEYSPDASLTPAISDVRVDVGDGSATITWQTDQPSTSQVDFGLDTKYGIRTPERTTLTSTHSVTLSGLGWAKTYHYRCRSKGTAGVVGRSPDFLFSTPSANAPTQIITGFGDHGDNSIAKEINRRAADERPVAHLHAGDWHYQSTTAAAQIWWDTTYAPLRASGARLLLALGNHEASPAWTTNMGIVGMGSRWYAATVGGIHFLVLDSNQVYNADQLAFIERELGAAQAHDWQMVVFHHTPFSSGADHGSDNAVRTRWSPLFDDYGVDVVVVGHEHSYERTTKVCASASVGGSCPVYVTVGGGGMGLDWFGGVAPLWSARRSSNHHYLRLEATRTEMHLSTIRRDGALIDSARITPNRASVSYIRLGDTWRYFKGQTDPAAGWKDVAFDDSLWSGGPTGIGYGDGDDATVLTDMQNNYLTVYTRRSFNLAQVGSSLRLKIDYDDGFVAYLNGTEVARRGLGTPGSAVNRATQASSHEAGVVETIDLSSSVPLLRVGTNILAVEVHNSNLGSSDLSFKPRLGGDGELAP